MAKIDGSFVRLSLPRRMMGHFLAASRNLQLVTGQRRFRLAEVIAARAQARPKPSMATLMVKAYANVCARRPELRRTMVDWPWARLFQYDAPVVSLVVERDYEGEPSLFLARIKKAERLSLAKLHEIIHHHQTRPIEEIERFRYALQMAALPAFIRKPLWRLIVNTMPRLKAKFFGTHGITATTGMRISGIHIVTPWTVALHYDAPKSNGEMDVRFTFDHRVYDAGYLARIGGDLEQELCGPILAELRAMRPQSECAVPTLRKAA